MSCPNDEIKNRPTKLGTTVCDKNAKGSICPPGYTRDPNRQNSGLSPQCNLLWWDVPNYSGVCYKDDYSTDATSKFNCCTGIKDPKDCPKYYCRNGKNCNDQIYAGGIGVPGCNTVGQGILMKNDPTHPCISWCTDPKNHGKCDVSMVEFCNLDPGNPYCSCLKSKQPVPSCLDKQCQDTGYKTYTMNTQTEHCPSVIQCNQTIKTIGSGNIVSSSQLMTCATSTGSTPINIPGTANGSTPGTANGSTPGTANGSTPGTANGSTLGTANVSFFVKFKIPIIIIIVVIVFVVLIAVFMSMGDNSDNDDLDPSIVPKNPYTTN